MTDFFRTLRPGLLVSLKTSIRGGVVYTTEEIEAEHYTSDGAREAAWSTRKRVADPQEHEQAIKVRSKARACITAVCSASDFGLLCPQSRTDDLRNAISEARAICDQFNRVAYRSNVKFYVVAGTIAQDDVEATRAIRDEVTGLLSDMETGIAKLDVKAVREAANKARNLGQMLDPDAASKLQDAITAARTVARRIVSAGETASTELDAYTMQALASARTAFLDIDETAAALPDMSTFEPARAIDFEPFDMIDTVDAGFRPVELEF